MVVCLNYYVYKQVKEEAKAAAYDFVIPRWTCHFKWHWIWMALLSFFFWIILRS